MMVRVSTWFGDEEFEEYSEDVNWGEDTLRFTSTVQNIVGKALVNYSGHDRPVTAISIDVLDEAVYAKEKEKWGKREH